MFTIPLCPRTRKVKKPVLRISAFPVPVNDRWGYAALAPDIGYFKDFT